MFTGNVGTNPSDLELISSLHQGPALLPWSQRTASIRLIFCASATIATTYILFLAIFRLLSYKKNNSKRWETPQRQKISYQATNLCVNFFLGTYGIYIWTTTVPELSSLDVTQTISGFQEFTPFAALQIGYNLWSLPMGLLVINESKTMIGHHIATLSVACVSCFSRYGLRYYCPFFYGVIEISSVPLTVMNFMREESYWVSDALYACVRTVFGAAFLLTRVVFWTPQIYEVLRCAGMLCYTCESGLCTLVTGSFCISAFSLTVLQYYWGLKVVRGLLAILVKKTEKLE